MILKRQRLNHQHWTNSDKWTDESNRKVYELVTNYDLIAQTIKIRSQVQSHEDQDQAQTYLLKVSTFREMTAKLALQLATTAAAHTYTHDWFKLRS